MQLCRLCCRPVNTRRPPGAEEPDTRRPAQDSTTAGQEEKGKVRMAVKMLGGGGGGGRAGTRVAGWSFSGDGEEGNESGRSERRRVARPPVLHKGATASASRAVRLANL